MWIILNVLMRSASGFSTAPADCHKVKVISARLQYRRAMAGRAGQGARDAVIDGEVDCNAIRHSGGLELSEPRGYRDPMVMCTASLVFA